MIPPNLSDILGRGQLYFGSAASTSYNWITIDIPRSAKFLSLILQGAGGRGGNGASGAAETQRGGGGGGGAGAAYIAMSLPTLFLPPSIHLNLAGRGSAQGSLIAYHENVANASNPVIASVSAGRDGASGTTTAAGAGGTASSFNNGVTSAWYGGRGINGAAGLAGTLGNNIPTTQLTAGFTLGAGAPGGGGVTSVSQNGGATYHSNYVKYVPSIINQAGAGGNGDHGYRFMSPFPIFTCGAGGGSNNTGQGGNGGDGGPGCGGGGGGAGVTGGQGGIGGEAWAWIMFQ